MIGRSLRERFGAHGPLPSEEAISTVKAVLKTQGENLVRVRAQGPRMIACLVVDADAESVRFCESIGLEMKPGGTAVFGLQGPDAAAAFPAVPPHQRAWLEAPCGPRETKVILLAHGIALLSIETGEGAVSITPVPAVLH